MIKKFVILLCLFVVGNLVSLRSEDVTWCWATLPDSIDNVLKLQKQTCEMFEKSEKLMEKLKAMNDEIKKRYDFPRFELLRTEKFDDTGLIRGKVKYFIRIWKHPPKEKFNMPIFK